MKKVLSFALVAAMSVGLLTACGGGGGDAAAEKITVEMGPGFVFKPADLELKKGTNYEITVVNKDTTPHTFVIKDLNAKSGNVNAGASKSFTVKPTKSGNFEIICDVAGHKEGGMHGTAKVQ